MLSWREIIADWKDTTEMTGFMSRESVSLACAIACAMAAQKILQVEGPDCSHGGVLGEWQSSPKLSPPISMVAITDSDSPESVIGNACTDATLVAVR